VQGQNAAVPYHSDQSKKKFPLIRSGSFGKDGDGGEGGNGFSRCIDATCSSQQNDNMETAINDAIIRNEQLRLCRKISFPHSKRTDYGRSRAMKLSGEKLETHQETEKVLFAPIIAVDQISDPSCLRVSQMENSTSCKCSPGIDKLEREREDNSLFAGRSKKVQFYEDQLVKLDSKLGSQFERLVIAIDSVTNQMLVEFGGLNERIDCLQRSLEADHGSGWKCFINRLHQETIDLVDGSCSIAKKSPATPAHSNPLRGAIEGARANIRLLSGLLIIEKDADLMRGRDFQDRDAMVLKMMRPYLQKPVFQQFWHMKHGMDHCVATLLFKTSHILARSVSNNRSEASMEASMAAQGEAAEQFNRFCKRGERGVEEFAEWPERNWSEHLKREFSRSCKAVWQLQRMVAAAKLLHEVEVLHPHPGSELDGQTMDSLECSLPPAISLSINHHNHRFQPLVQFTVFPGFKIDGTVLCKAQVYLQPKRGTSS
jgi:hypothetical protein